MDHGIGKDRKRIELERHSYEILFLAALIGSLFFLIVMIFSTLLRIDQVFYDLYFNITGSTDEFLSGLIIIICSFIISLNVANAVLHSYTKIGILIKKITSLSVIPMQF